jgi:hypothetical protein
MPGSGIGQQSAPQFFMEGNGKPDRKYREKSVDFSGKPVYVETLLNLIVFPCNPCLFERASNNE